MALNYNDIHQLRNHPDVVTKTHVAIAAVAVDILQPESPTSAARQTWAVEAIKNPASKTSEIVHYVLIANDSAANQAAVIGALDSVYKSAVADAINKIVGVAV